MQPTGEKRKDTQEGRATGLQTWVNMVHLEGIMVNWTGQGLGDEVSIKIEKAGPIWGYWVNLSTPLS